jgi:hypothetical protein
MQRLEERRRRLGERFSGPLPPMPPTPPIPPMRPVAPKPPVGTAPSSEPKVSKVSAEERMLILKMLSEGRISADEANNLLEALEKGAG